MKDFKQWYVKNYPKEAARMGKALVIYVISIAIGLLTLIVFPWYFSLTCMITSTVIYLKRKSKFNKILDNRMDEFEGKI